MCSVHRPWATSAGNPDTAQNAFIGDTSIISDKVLDRAGVVINSGAPVLSFRNNFDTEFSDGTYWDGGVLEISSPNINGGAFTDVTNPAVGGSFVSGPYTGTISPDASNPLAGRDGVEWEFRGLHRHGDKHGAQPQRTNHHAALAHGHRRSGRGGVAH